MNIVRAEKGSITRIQKVFKFLRSSGSNGAGLPVGGTDGQSLVKSGVANFIAIWRALTSSDVGLGNVINVLQLVASDIGTTVQAFTAVLQATTASFTTALLAKLNGIEALAEVNNISDTDATDLTDSGETTLHSHPGGGGGGGEWEVVETRVMSGNAIELFDVGADDIIKVTFDSVVRSSSGYVQLSLSIDNGVSYPAKHSSGVAFVRSNAGTVGNHIWEDKNEFRVNLNIEDTGPVTGDLEFIGITDSGNTRCYDYDIAQPIGDVIFGNKGVGIFYENGAVNKIKVSASAGVLSTGSVTISKRLF